MHFGSYHHETSDTYDNMGMPSIAIIREPVERYLSTYNYMSNGSNKYIKTYKELDKNEFVDRHYKLPDFIKIFERGV